MDIFFKYTLVMFENLEIENVQVSKDSLKMMLLTLRHL